MHLLNSADANILPVDNEAIEKISAEELMNAIDRLAAVVKTVSEGLKTTSEQICKQRSTPKLGIKKEQIVSEQDFPLLEKFETFKLPIQSKEDLERLESNLSESHDFLKFFVRNFSTQC